jgi:hypothetical protein
MLKTGTTPTRAPRGTKPVSQAFFTALDAIPVASRAAVAKAAQVMIRDELKTRQSKMKATAAKEKARKAAAPVSEPAVKPPAQGKVAKHPLVNGAMDAPKRRGRKPKQDAPVE